MSTKHLNGLKDNSFSPFVLERDLTKSPHNFTTKHLHKLFYMKINPSLYGLSSRIELDNLGENRVAIRKLVKSRIIQKDALKIVEVARQIKSVTPEMRITLLCYRNICSKSVILLENEDIEIEYREI